MPADFHFLHPLWLLALLPLGLLLAMLVRGRGGAGAWQRVIEPQLLAALTVGSAGRPRRWPLVLLGLGWLLAVLALADPTFERVSVPAFRDAAARVAVLDVSQSMLADDLSPSRLERARFKVQDILRRADPGQAGGQVGLVVFAGDAFTVSPLTDDADTIRGMLEALSPEIMPAQGSRPDLGIVQALELLRQAGVRDGEVVLLTDDAGGARARSAATDLRRAGHRLAVIGVGTEEGAAVPGARTSRGAVIARLDPGALRSLARSGGGEYARITVDDSDLRQVLRGDTRTRIRDSDKPQEAEIWKELGPWVALALAPLAAFGFRRGWLLLPVLLALHLGAVVPTPVWAQPAGAPAAPSAGGALDGHWRQGWRDLWQRRDQQAAGALARGAVDRALEVAKDPARAGAASYRLGDFDAAAQAFAGGDSADHHYNRGNALARGGQLEDALAAYDAALAQDPDMADARYNRQQVEEALRRQQEQSQQEQSGQQSEQPSSDQRSEQGESQQQPSQGSAGQQGDDQPSGGEQADAGSEQPDQAQGQGQDPGQDQAQESGQDDAGTRGEQSAEHDAAQEGEGGAPSQSAEAEQAAGQDAPDAGDQPGQADDQSPAEAEQRRAAEAQAAEDYRNEAEAASSGGEQADATGDAATAAGGGDLPDTAALEDRQAADQWLRRIPDDPAGLLRRKFLYQYRLREGQRQGGPPQNPW